MEPRHHTYRLYYIPTSPTTSVVHVHRRNSQAVEIQRHARRWAQYPSICGNYQSSLGGCPSLTFTDAKGLDERVRRVFPGIGREQQALQPFHFARKRVYVKSHIRKGAVLTGRKFAGPMAGMLISILSDGAHYVQSHCPRAFRHL